MEIYYNPRCSKCREALGLIKSKGKSVHIVDYLNNPPSIETLQSIIKVLGIKPIDLVRKNESLFLEKYKGKKISSKRWLTILAKYPILIQRPIVLDGNQAIIGRPPELILNLL